MRASLLAVVVFALVSGCSPDEPDDVAVVSEAPAPVRVDVLQPAPAPEQVDNLPELLDAARQVQAEEECRQLVALEAFIRTALTRYTEQHPDVVAARQEIARLRSELPADGTFCSEQLERKNLNDER